MKFPQLKQLPPEIIGKLKPILKSSFEDYAYAYIQASQTGTKYLTIPFPEEEEFAVMVEISETRLEIIKGGEMNLIFPFANPEKGIFYLAELNEDGIEKLAYYSPDERDFDWPIPDNLSVNFELIDKKEENDLLDYAKQRNRFTLDIVVEFENFKDSTIKLSSIKRYLVPFHDMVKTALLSNTIEYNSKNIEEKLHMGFAKIEFKCLHGILEFDYNLSPNTQLPVLENITNLYLLLGADNSDEIFKYLKHFSDKKIIAQYITLLRKITQDKSFFKSKMATPDSHYADCEINRSRSRKLQKIISEEVDTIEYEETVTGILAKLDYTTSKKRPLFSLVSTADDVNYNGTISEEADKKIREEFVNFTSHEYECQLKVTLTPATQVNDEKIRYELIDFNEIGEIQNKFPFHNSNNEDDIPW